MTLREQQIEDDAQMKYLSEWKWKKQARKAELRLYRNEAMVDFKLFFLHIGRYFKTLLSRC